MRRAVIFTVAALRAATCGGTGRYEVLRAHYTTAPKTKRGSLDQLNHLGLLALHGAIPALAAA